jgi:hypothetical protein
MALAEIETFETILHAWTLGATTMPTSEQRDSFRQFLDWCSFHGVPMPAEGEEAGHFLLDLLMSGATLESLQQTAEAIVLCYELHHWPLYQVPIRAALEMAAAQLAPGRVLN